MPRTVHVPAYRLHKPSGQARVILRGRQVYLGPYGSPESQKKYARLIAEHAANPTGVVPFTASVQTGGKLLIVQPCAAYLEHAQRYCSRNGEPTGSMPRVKACLRVLRARYGHTPADEFGPLQLQAVQRHLVDQGKSRRYVNHLVRAIRRVFRWGASQELVPITVYHGLGTVQGIVPGTR